MQQRWVSYSLSYKSLSKVKEAAKSVNIGDPRAFALRAGHDLLTEGEQNENSSTPLAPTKGYYMLNPMAGNKHCDLENQ